MKKNGRWLLLVVVVLVGISLLMPGSRAERSIASAPLSPLPGNDLLFKSDADLTASRLFLPDQGSAPAAVGDITVRSANAGGTAGFQTFTLVKEYFTSTDCTSGSLGAPSQNTLVNSSTGVTIPKPATANSVKLIAPNQDNQDLILKSDQHSHWVAWTSPDGAVPPGESFHNQRICVPYSAVPATRTFVAQFSPGYITRASSGGVCGAATEKTLFNLGEQVCVQFFFNPALAGGGFMTAQMASPGYPSSCIRHTTTPQVTVDGGTSTSFTLPATDTDTGCGPVSDNRGNWGVTLVDLNGTQGQGNIRVHNPTAGHEAVDLLVSKFPTGGVNTVNCGSNLSWDINVVNLGPDPAQNATLVDSLSAATGFVSITAPGWTCITPPVGTSGLISCTNPSLPAFPLGGNQVVSTLTLVAQALPSQPRFMRITNGAIVSSLTYELANQQNVSDVSITNSITTTATGCASAPTIIRSTGTTVPTLITESCGSVPRNGAVDPGELVSMSFCVQNVGDGALPGGISPPLQGTLRAAGGITNPEAGPKSFTPTPPLNGVGSEGCATFSFRAANVRCGSNLIATIDFSDATHTNLGSVNFPIQTGVGSGSTPFVCCAGPTASMGTITGTITDGGMPVSGAVVKLTGSQNRTLITDASGTYRFDDVETNGFYTVTPSRANYTFNPRDQSFSQAGNTTNAAFTATRNAVMGLNDIDTPGYFVRQHYLDFLGREPDESGFNFWSDQMLQCGNDAECLERRRINVSAAYFLSIEFQQSGGLVDRLYHLSYDRRPLYNEFTPDRQTIARDVRVGYGNWAEQLEENKRAFVEAWMQRAAFRAAYDGLPNDQYVARLIEHTGVNFSQAEKAALVSGLTAGNLTRADILRQIAEDERFVAARRNESFVMMQYFGYLGRDPDESGYQFWLAKLNQFNGNFEQAEMVKAFLVSGEYRARFAP